MADKEQVRPLAPAALRINVVDDDDAMSSELKKHHFNRKYIKCCGCIIALMLIQAMVILVLIFTVLRVKDPVLKIDSEEVEGLDLVSNATLPPGKNLTFTIEFRVKNPNVASFKYENVTTGLYYGGVLVGEGRNPPGEAAARRTLQMNVTVNVMPEKISAVSGSRSDLSSGGLNMSSHTLIRGKVKILNVIKKRVEVKVNCNMTVDIAREEIEIQFCKRRALP